jgi:hypothetical protein
VEEEGEESEPEEATETEGGPFLLVTQCY